MKHAIFSLLVLFSATLFAQEGPKPTQLREITDGHVIIGGTNGASDNGNTTVLLNATNVPATAPAGYTGTTTQALIDELAVNAGGDGWGTDVVTSNATLTGDGTAGSPLAVDPAQIATSTLNNDAGFITSPDDADADPANEAQTISKTGSTVTLTAAGGAGGGTFEDNAIANTQRGCITATGATVTLPAAVGSFNSSIFTINSVQYQASAANTTALQVTGTTLQAGTLNFPIEAGDEVCFDYAL